MSPQLLTGHTSAMGGMFVFEPVRDHRRAIARAGRDQVVGTKPVHTREAVDQVDGMVVVHGGIGHYTEGEKSNGKPSPLAHFLTQWMRRVVHDMKLLVSQELWVNSVEGRRY